MSDHNEELLIKPRRPMPALDLAEAFLEDMPVSDAQQEARTRNAVLMAGEHLAETVGPGQWEGFDAAVYFRQIDFYTPREQEEIGLTLMGFFGWLFFAELLHPERCLRILDAIRQQFPDSMPIQNLYAATEPMLTYPAPMAQPMTMSQT